MKRFEPKFTYWEDDHTKLIKESKSSEFLDPHYYLEAHIHKVRGVDQAYFLNRRCRTLMERHGPFVGRYVDGEKLVGREGDEPCYIVCPGPSLKEVDKGRIEGTVLAVNSAGFALVPDYWVMAESAYALWLIRNGPSIPRGREVIATARVAVCLRDWEMKKGEDVFSRINVVRWEEEKIVPPRVPAVSVFNALVSAWQMGFEEVRILGLDLSKDGGPYVEGVPYTKEGAENPFDDQIKALSQFYLPDFRILNGSPKSGSVLNFDYVSYKEMGLC